MVEKGYVFISYSSKDTVFVQQLINVLNEHDIAYWKAPEMIPAGSNYAKEIPQAINNCKVFLMVVSQTSQESIWVEKEVDTAICAKKVIIPVHIDKIPLNEMYRFYLNNVQMIEAGQEDSGTDGAENAVQRIKDVFDEQTSSIRVKEVNVTEKRTDKRSNALRINKIPLECEFCGGAVEQISMGIYRCLVCNAENYDDFQKVRNYLEKAGPSPIAVISRNTGVSTKTIEYFWNEEFLEIPSAMSVRLYCSKCGAPIRSGNLCDSCKRLNQKNNL